MDPSAFSSLPVGRHRLDPEPEPPSARAGRPGPDPLSARAAYAQLPQHRAALPLPLARRHHGLLRGQDGDQGAAVAQDVSQDDGRGGRATFAGTVQAVLSVPRVVEAAVDPVGPSRVSAWRELRVANTDIDRPTSNSTHWSNSRIGSCRSVRLEAFVSVEVALSVVSCLTLAKLGPLSKSEP